MILYVSQESEQTYFVEHFCEMFNLIKQFIIIQQFISISCLTKQNKRYSPFSQGTQIIKGDSIVGRIIKMWGVIQRKQYESMNEVWTKNATVMQ